MSDDVERLAEAWLDGARARLDRAELGAKVEEIGRVEEVGDGVALVSGLPDVAARRAAAVRQGGQFGFAQTLERDRVGCVLLDDAEAVEAGDAVRGTGDVVRVPVGPALLGRIVDPLGRPLDGGGPIAANAREPIERPAPAIIDRDLVDRAGADRHAGHRRAVRARPRPARADHRRPRDRQDHDRASTRSSTRRRSDIVCVYVAVGQKTFERARARSTRSGARRRPSAASSWSPRRRARPGCNGSRRSPASPWPSISATAASTRWSSSTI